MVLYLIKAFLFAGMAVKFCFIHNLIVCYGASSIKEDACRHKKSWKVILGLSNFSSFIFY
jgi:hypothetical protein